MACLDTRERDCPTSMVAFGHARNKPLESGCPCCPGILCGTPRPRPPPRRDDPRGRQGPRRARFDRPHHVPAGIEPTRRLNRFSRMLNRTSRGGNHWPRTWNRKCGVRNRIWIHSNAVPTHSIRVRAQRSAFGPDRGDLPRTRNRWPVHHAAVSAGFQRLATWDHDLSGPGALPPGPRCQHCSPEKDGHRRPQTAFELESTMSSPKRRLLASPEGLVRLAA